MAGQNGTLTSANDGSIPAQEVGEDMLEGDVVGFRDDANSRTVMFKAYAGVTGKQVASIAVTSGGSGYTTAPTVTFTGGAGVGASATAAISGGAVTTVTVVLPGSGFTSAPTIGFTGGGGTGAAATATLTSAAITQVPAKGVVANDALKGSYRSVRPNRWRLALPTPLPAALSGLKVGEYVYTSISVPGALQRTKPTATGNYVQVVGIAYWDGERDTGINANEAANSVLIDIQPGAVV